VLAVLKELGLNDPERNDVNRSGNSLGHPIGATGGQILCKMLQEPRRRGRRFGLETRRIGGGLGVAAVFDRLYGRKL
jgi:acetyl-CoA C-acetyltransferase